MPVYDIGILRTSRRIEAGMVYPALNRGNGRRTRFAKESHFHAFVKLPGEAPRRFGVESLSPRQRQRRRKEEGRRRKPT